MNPTSTKDSARITEALSYAKQGWQVHPLYGIRVGKCACGKPTCTGNSRGKHPVLQEWQNIATTDETVIKGWWERWTDANIGIVTGQTSGLVVLDIDPKHGGSESLYCLESQFGKLPGTVETVTGNGGRHLYFAYPKNTAHIPNAAPLAGYPGIDVRGDKGYIVAPPSIHYTGKTYEWELSSHPDDVPLAQLPDWLLRLLVDRPNNGEKHGAISQPGWVSRALAGVSEGERNNTCIKLAGHFKHKGLDFETTLTILYDWATRCTPPLPTNEVEKCVKSAYSYIGEKQRVQHDNTHGFNLTSLSDLMAEPEEIDSWLWENTLPTGGLSLVSAKPKVGKSTWARNLALRVARGEPFLGRDTTQGAVIYLALEEKRSEVAGHFTRMGAEDENILIHTGSAPEEALTALERAIKEHEAVLAIVDPLFRMVRVNDGNDYVQVNRALEPLLMLARDTHCHILTVHHMSKGEREGGDAILGSTALFASVDTALLMKKRDTGRTIESSQRYGEDIPKTALNFNSELGILETAGTVEELELERVKQAIMVALSDSRLTEKEIRDAVGGNTGLVGKGLRELVADDKVEREGSGKKSDPFTYGKMLVSRFPSIDKQQKRAKLEKREKRW